MRAERLFIGLWLALVVLAVFWLLTRLQVAQDLSLFLPAGATPQEQALVEALRRGGGSRLVLVGLEAQDRDSAARAGRALAQALRESALADEVLDGPRGLDAASEALLFTYRFLLDPAGSVGFEEAALNSALLELREALAAPVALLDKARLAADPTGAYRRVLASWQGEGGPAIHDGVWMAAEGPPTALLVLRLAPGQGDVADAQAIARLRALHGHYAGTTRLQLTGPAVFATDARAAIRADVTRLSLLGSLAVIGLGFLAWRSLRRVVLMVLPLASGLLFALCATGLVFGTVHGITLAFGMVLIGVAADYPLHLFAHGRAAPALWRALTLGVLTTVLAFAVLLWSDFGGLSQLGLFVGVGLIAAALVTRGVVAPLMGPERPLRLPLPTGFKPLAAGPWLVGGAALLAAAWLALSPRAFDASLSSLSPVSEAQRAMDKRLREALGAPDVRHLLRIDAPDMPQALRLAEQAGERLDRLVAEGVLARADNPARRLPAEQTQQARQAALPDASILRARLEAAARASGLRAAVFQPWLDAVEAARTLPPLRLADLPPALAERLAAQLTQDASGAHLRIALSGVRLPEALATGWPPGVLALDTLALSERMVERFRVEAGRHMGWAALAMLLVLALSLRRGGRLLGVVLPVLAAVLVTSALLSLGAHPPGLFHWVSLILVAGLALDYAVFFQMMPADEPTRRRTLGAVWMCALSTVLVFGLLALSRVPVLQAIGVTVTLGVACALAFSLLMRPRPSGRAAG